MSRVLGIGGESIVIQQMIDTKLCAVKFVPFNADVRGILGYLDPKHLLKDEQSAELIPTEMDHPNIIQYMDNLFQTIDNRLFHITGKPSTAALLCVF